MAGFSTHGFVIALLQGAFVLGLLWLQSRWRRRRRGQGRPDSIVTWTLALVLVVEFAALRYQPIRMGGSAFEYTLGLFDAFTVVGLLLLVHDAMAARTPG